MVFVELENTKLELLHPLGDNSPITGFLKKKPGGGMHHICLEVRVPTIQEGFCLLYYYLPKRNYTSFYFMYVFIYLFILFF